MKKPANGDQLTLRYQGATVKATCSEVSENPALGPGAAKITIRSETAFQKGGEAFLVGKGNEIALTVARVTKLPHNATYIVSFVGVFQSKGAASSQPAAPRKALRPS